MMDQYLDSEDGGDAIASEESYYVSITDLLIGLLFIFIILLVFFAAQFRDTSEQIVSSNQTRAELLRKMADDMSAQGIEVSLDLPRGILRLSGSGLFEVGDRDPTQAGAAAIDALAETMARNLPCYAFAADGSPPAGCAPAPHTVDTIVLEGHTDEDRVVTRGWVEDNWDLSAARATSTFRRLLADKPSLAALRNAAPGSASVEPLFSAAGYADQRPIVTGSDAAAKAANRRIDIRIVMAPPSPKDLAPVAADDLTWKRTGIARPLGWGKRLTFARGRSTDAYLGIGWSRPESWGVWSNGTSAPLILPLKRKLQGKAVRLDIKGLAFLDDNDPQRRVRLVANGQPVDTWVFDFPDNQFERSLVLPAEVTGQGDMVTLVFEVENPNSPLSLGLSADGRALGVALASVKISQP